MNDGGDEKSQNKTVFRPSPLQGLRGADAPRAAAGTTFQPGPAAPPPPEAPAPASGSGAIAPAAAPPADDDIPQPPPGARPRNPMMAAAAPVLSLMAGVRSGRVQITLPELHQKVSAAVGRFDQALAAAGYDVETRQRARYAVCATVDDIAQNLPGHAADGAEWARRSLVVMAFNENIGGDRFWRLLDEMLANPGSQGDLLELYHACLAAGFEGRYRVTPDGKSKLQELLTRAYSALQHPRSLSMTEVAPHWRGRPTPAQRVGFWAPLALAAGVAAAVLLVVFIILRLVLMQTGQPSMQALRAINPDQPLRLSRVAPPPPAPTSTQLQRIQGFLAPEIAQHLVVVEQDPSSIRIRTTVGQLFRSGSDTLEPGRRPLFERIAAAVQTEPGPVRVEGHADSDRVASLAFPDNAALSRARADAVAGILRSRLTDGGRVTAEGFGDSQPIASNATPEGKATNRRVEIVLQRVQ